jgi:hypothetical protein
MLAAALLASWWAQAEPAPDPTPPTPPQPPAAAAPPSGTAAPPAAAPTPANAGAEPAPVAAAPTAGPHPAATATVAPAAPPPVLDNAFGVYACFARRLGSEGQSIGPANGVSVGGDYERRTFDLPTGFELGVGLDFFYDRFSSDLSGSMQLDPGLAQRVVSQTSFALMQTAGWRRGRVRPFAKVGVGATIAFFSSPEIALRPGSFDAVQPLARGAAGLSVDVVRGIAVSLQGTYTHTFTRPVFTTADGNAYSFLGDVLDLGLGVVMQF